MQRKRKVQRAPGGRPAAGLMVLVHQQNVSCGKQIRDTEQGEFGGDGTRERYLSRYWCPQTVPLPWHTSWSRLQQQDTLQMSAC